MGKSRTTDTQFISGKIIHRTKSLHTKSMYLLNIKYYMYVCIYLIQYKYYNSYIKHQNICTEIDRILS